MSFEQIQAAVAKIRGVAPGFTPKMGLVLGSGMGGVAKILKGLTGEGDPVAIPYGDLEGFPVSTVVGHAGQLLLGVLEGVPVACLQGRCHLYEGHDPQAIRLPIYVLKHLGCEVLYSTSAVGSLRETVGPGELCAVTDHINFQGKHPLIGPNDDRIGGRFVSMLDAYDPELRAKLLEVGKEVGVNVHEGVYMAFTGPTFETPAEIRMARTMGADLAGMSVVGETIAARHVGLKVVTIGIVVNLAAGMTSNHINHEETLHFTGQAADRMMKLTTAFVKTIAG